MDATSPTRPAVPRIYDQDDQGVVYCIAPGPSLTYGDCRHIYELPPAVATIITINDAYRPFPHAQVRFAGDGQWWMKRTDAHDPTKYGGRCYCLEYGGPERVQRLDYRSDIVLSENPGVLATGGHSGYAAVNMAFLMGATTIVLVGYDMQPMQGAGPTAGHHHFGGDEPGQKHLRYHLWIPRYKPLFDSLQIRGVALINATRQTAIPEQDVPRAHLDEIL